MGCHCLLQMEYYSAIKKNEIMPFSATHHGSQHSFIHTYENRSVSDSLQPAHAVLKLPSSGPRGSGSPGKSPLPSLSHCSWGQGNKAKSQAVVGSPSVFPREAEGQRVVRPAAQLPPLQSPSQSSLLTHFLTTQPTPSPGSTRLLFSTSLMAVSRHPSMLSQEWSVNKWGRASCVQKNKQNPP